MEAQLNTDVLIALLQVIQLLLYIKDCNSDVFSSITLLINSCFPQVVDCLHSLIT